MLTFYNRRTHETVTGLRALRPSVFICGTVLLVAGELVDLPAEWQELPGSHMALLASLRSEGHNVSAWATDPSGLRAYAAAIDFVEA
jgi:hypothetical protein